MRRGSLPLFIVLLVFSFLASFIGASAWASPRRPRVGLALSGGGARGIALIGVLKSLERLKVPIDFIAGTSIGSLVGALYASGYTVREIEDIFERTDWNDILFEDRAARADLPLRRKVDHGRYLFDFEMGYKEGRFVLPSGLVHGQKFSLLLNSLFLRVFSIDEFSRLPIPFKAVAGNAETGEMVVLERGHLADAVRASAAYPGLFSPVEIEGQLLIDGGAVNNLPVDIVKRMGADIVIAVDISSPLQGRNNLATFVDFSDQFVTILMRRTLQSQVDLAKVVLRPKLQDERTFSYSNFAQLVKAGEDETLAHQEILKPYRVSDKEFERFRAGREQPRDAPKSIDKIQVGGFKRVDAHTVANRLNLKEGSSFNADELEAELRKIYSLGDFERVDYAMSRRREKNVLSIRAVEKHWGPNYLHFGATWDGEIQGKCDGNALLNLQMTRLNRLNAEWITDIQLGTVLSLMTEFYQPLDYWGLFFLAPKLSALRMYEDFYRNEKRVAEYEIDAIAGALDLGIDLKKFGELRVGLRRGMLNSESALASSAIPSYEVQTGSWVAKLKFDQLDSAYFPSQGIYLNSDFLSSQRYLGADVGYRKLSAEFHAFYTHQRHTIFLSTGGGGNLGSQIPLYDEFLLGGFRSLSGYRMDELRGQYYGLGRVGYLCKVPVSATVFWSRFYVGAWGEAGNTWNQRAQVGLQDLRYAGTLAVGLDTKLGPVFLGYGQAGSQHRQFYISVGRTFGIQNPRVF